jgi:hypothetical protein
MRSRKNLEISFQVLCHVTSSRYELMMSELGCRHTLFLHSGQLVWSGLEPESTRQMPMQPCEKFLYM